MISVLFEARIQILLAVLLLVISQVIATFYFPFIVHFADIILFAISNVSITFSLLIGF